MLFHVCIIIYTILKTLKIINWPLDIMPVLSGTSLNPWGSSKCWFCLVKGVVCF
jgi:hypothetical protein